jgi:hypothetical protein
MTHCMSFAFWRLTQGLGLDIHNYQNLTQIRVFGIVITNDETLCK